MARRDGARGDIREVRRGMYRQQILTAAEFEFARAGFAEARVSGIAATADVSLATLYKNFTGKDEIWNALNAKRMNELVGMAREAIDRIESPIEHILAGVRAQVEFFAQHPNFLRLHIKEGWSWATATELGRGGQRQVWNTGIEMMTGAAQAAAQAGELPSDVSPAIVAGLAISALQVWLTNWANAATRRPAGVVADELVAHLRRSLSLDVSVRSLDVPISGPTAT